LKKGTLGEGMPPKSNSEWKAWRIQLASSNPGLNKAGRPYGKGTTSKARMARRARASEEEEEDPPYTPSNHDWGDGWGDGWGGGWGESSWQPWSGEVPWSWRDQDWWVEEGQEREEVRLQSAMRSPSNSPCARGRKRHPRRRSRGCSSSTSPGWDRDTARGVPARGRLPRLQMSTPLHLHLWKKGKKQGKGAKVWLQLQASSGEKKQFPLTKKRKKETSGWMKKKKNTPPGDEGHPW